MTDASAIEKAATELCKRIDDKVGELPLSVSNTSRRELFGEVAALRNRAERERSTETLEVLDTTRSKLRLPRKPQTGADKASMYVRLFFAAFVAMWGSLCILIIVPVRLLHPLCRKLGVPNGRLPLDMAVDHWAKAVLAAAGVKVTIEEGALADWVTQADLVGIIVYNHASNLDPFIINSSCNIGPKYIGKKILFMVPVLGWLFTLCGMVPINRGDREKAVNTMNESVAGIMKNSGRSVAISPEGTRSTDGHLRLPFKKGVFHLQEKTKVPLLPIVIHGAQELWPPGRSFSAPGEVIVSFLPPQYPEEASKDWSSRDTTRLALQAKYCELVAKTPHRGAGVLSSMDVAISVCRLLVTLFVYSMIWRLLPNLGAALWAGIFASITIAMAVYVEKCL